MIFSRNRKILKIIPSKDFFFGINLHLLFLESIYIYSYNINTLCVHVNNVAALYGNKIRNVALGL